MQEIDSLDGIASRFDAIVLDQWGVLHDGSAPYPGAVAALERLRDGGTRLAVLSNSGKRSDLNRDRIAAKGFATELFEVVMTSGEALWDDLSRGALPYRRLWPITAAPGDAEAFAEGLEVALTDGPGGADAVLLMGLPEGIGTEEARTLGGRMKGLPVLCSNPDRASPRAGGGIAISPGSLAHAHDGEVRWYGKPHRPVFDAVARALGTSNLLMVGDSLEHDIAGGHAAGWATCFVRGGLHAAAFGEVAPTVHRLAEAEGAPLPDYTASGLGG